MATCTILLEYSPYYRVRVEFAGQQFDQTVVIGEAGSSLMDQLQAYADEYQNSWVDAEFNSAST